jgi:hypothetical protein
MTYSPIAYRHIPKMAFEGTGAAAKGARSGVGKAASGLNKPRVATHVVASASASASKHLLLLLLLMLLLLLLLHLKECVPCPLLRRKRVVWKSKGFQASFFSTPWALGRRSGKSAGVSSVFVGRCRAA